MNRDKIKVYFLELFMLIILIFALFVSSIFNKITIAIILGIIAIICSNILKRRSILSIYKKQVLLLMIMFGFIYLVFFYLLGMYFGFYRSIYFMHFRTIYKYIIPISVIIISSEVIRGVLLAYKFKFNKQITFIICVLIDFVVYGSVYDLSNLSDFLAAIGFILFASISCNLLYSYVSKRFGILPVIIYRIIIVMYTYTMPFIPDVYIFFRSFLRMLYPYLIYLVLEGTYAKSNFAIAYKDKTKSIISVSILMVFLTLFIMLISCKFKYGILVIGSGSMTGTINKGDAVVFEKYEDQDINKGDIIIFQSSELEIVHRVIEIKKVDGEFRYYTKGDANSNEDDGYRVESDILGVVHFKISYVGYPSLWVRDLFS